MVSSTPKLFSKFFLRGQTFKSKQWPPKIWLFMIVLLKIHGRFVLYSISQQKKMMASISFVIIKFLQRLKLNTLFTHITVQKENSWHLFHLFLSKFIVRPSIIIRKRVMPSFQQHNYLRERVFPRSMAIERSCGLATVL